MKKIFYWIMVFLFAGTILRANTVYYNNFDGEETGAAGVFKNTVAGDAKLYATQNIANDARFTVSLLPYKLTESAAETIKITVMGRTPDSTDTGGWIGVGFTRAEVPLGNDQNGGKPWFYITPSGIISLRSGSGGAGSNYASKATGSGNFKIEFVYNKKKGTADVAINSLPVWTDQPLTFGAGKPVFHYLTLQLNSNNQPESGGGYFSSVRVETDQPVELPVVVETGAEKFFELRKMIPLIASYEAPSAAFDPAGKWTHVYQIFTLGGGRFSSQGTVEIERTPLAGGTSRMDVRIKRNATDGFYHYTTAELTCADDIFSTPAKWTVNTKIAKNETDAGYLLSEMTRQSEFKNGEYIVKTGSLQQSYPLSTPYTTKYNLFDAVQRMPAETGAPQNFNCLDDFDEARPADICWLESAEIGMKNGKQKMNRFLQTGEGVVPTCYWTDPSGRLLFYISGIEILVLDSENGKSIPYRKDREIFIEAAELIQKGGF